jgi:ABC-type multidrug transport system fused ATPase/permease subunit
MLSLIQKFFRILDKKDKKIIFFLQFQLIFMSILETISILMLGPYIALASGAISYDQNILFNFLSNKLNITSKSELLFNLGLIMLFVYILSSFISILTIYIINFFSGRISAKISSRVFYFFFNKTI